ncbi:MAG: methyltransferase [Pseudomonadota bacterium]
MNRLIALLQSGPANLLVSALLAITWAIFAIAHVHGFQASGNWTYLLFFLAESLAALFFLLRTRPVTVSTSVLDWLLAIGATFGPFLLRPAAWGLVPAAALLLAAGCLMQIAGLLALNRSFGLVAAKRRIKTAGVYQLVRHPLYASYLVSFAGYLLSNTSMPNLLVCLAEIALLLLRLVREERHLAHDASYRAYMREVKYRLVPWVF